MLYKVMKKIFVLIIIFTSSCSSLKTISDVENTVEQKINFYVKKYAPAATKNMRFFKIPASITLAQGILESGYGEGTLAKKANNHFGIKCHKEWKGKSITHDDDEKDECFRSYKNPLRSYRDHSLFLVDRDRYSSLFTLNRKDYKGWAIGLKAAGYATDPKYAEKLISLIERFNLTRFDE
jgi:flagellum-specific peptidoglycan hydrolase FlgJ